MNKILFINAVVLWLLFAGYTTVASETTNTAN
jgi:hypothetical protein